MYALCIRISDDLIEFDDVLQESYSHKLRNDIGDFVLRQADGVYACQLAVVVDDAEQNITHVVRGCRSARFYAASNFFTAITGLFHTRIFTLPIVTNTLGEKLGKQTHAVPVDLSNALMQLVDALHFLGQKPPIEMIEGDISSFWQWASTHWRVDQIPH